MSCYIRKLNKEVGNCLGGILLTASHNPGGPEEDFGIKYNVKNGGPAPEDFTAKIYENCCKIQEYFVADFDWGKTIDINTVSTYEFTNVDRPDKNKFVVKVIDPYVDYLNMFQGLFDFPKLKALIARPDFKFCFDGLNGVAGGYAQSIFVDQLGCDPSSLQDCVPLPDFGGSHPDPNLVYAKKLVEKMDISKQKPAGDVPNFGAACDGDADRNMVLGKQFFITPSDSLAVLVANSKHILKHQIKGASRSMPTSGALDKVCEKLGLVCYEVPTGWKFFGNLLDAGKISICGEESFGTSSSHIREKDGIWAILAWLSLLAVKNEGSQKIVEVEDILKEHWATFGRNYYCRFDYENVDAGKAKEMMDLLHTKFSEFESLKEGNKADVFDYTDPIDKSVSPNQGLRFVYKDGTRVVFRLSGTGSVGATIRIYFEKYEKDNIHLDNMEALKEIIELGLKLSNIEKLTGRTEPTVIT